jgi:hypothetical protein
MCGQPGKRRAFIGELARWAKPRRAMRQELKRTINMTNSIRAAFSALILAGVLGAVGVAPASAMTKKACEDAWHQAKAAGQSPGTFKTYQAANCAGDAPAAATPAAQPASAPAAEPAAASAGPMTRKACEDAWHQAKAAGQSPGTFKTYQAANCNGAAPAAAAPAAEPAPAPAPAAQPAPAPVAQPAPAPAPAPAKPAPAVAKPAPTAAAQPTGAGEFATDTEAKSHCPTANVVWVNTKTHIFHYAGHPRYGKTKQGAYMCEADATAAGDRASKSEKAPQ